MGSLTAAIPDGALVVIDSVAFIYFLEQHPRYGSAASELFERVEQGQLQALASALVLAEVLVTPLRQGDVTRARAVSLELRRFPNLRLRAADAEVAERAAHLRARHGLKTPDALHAATGLRHSAEWIVTNDLSLRRVASDGLRPWLFDDYV
ncbi:MAG TPA: type II toxin-antitoxin system VapC family toxin [Longimicrobiaceae bacterium]|nr:type II toxin-antitoxin system VapC family toxin [Longimicrobiaceae bacterium]